MIEIIIKIIFSLFGILGIILNVLFTNIPNIILDKSSTNIVSREEYHDYYIEKTYDNYMIALKNGKYGAIDYEGKEIIPFEYNSIGESNSQLVTFKNNNYYSIYNNQGKELIKNQKVDLFIKNEINDNYYYLVNRVLYDLNGKKIASNVGKDVEVYDNIVYTNSNITNLTDGKIYREYGFVAHYDNYMIFACNYNDDYLLYDISNKTMKKYKGYSYNALIDSSGKKYYVDYGTNDLSANKTIKYNDSFALKRINDEIQLIKGDNKVIAKGDYYEFYKSDDKKAYLIKINEKYYALLNNGNYKEITENGIIKTFKSYININNYIITDEDIYETDCYGGINNDVCYNGLSYYHMNDNKEKVSDYYDELECLGDYCSARNNNIYYLTYKDKIVYEGNDRKFFLVKDKIIADTIDGIIIYKLGKGKALKDKEIAKRISIDYSEILPDLEENGYESLDDGNSQEFYKYAFYVLKNKELDSIKLYCFELFNFINENLSMLDEYNFYKYLSILKVEFNKQNLLKDGAVGLYESDSVQISYARDEKTMNDKSRYALPHEFMHFMDHNFCIEDKYIQSDKKIFSDLEYNKLESSEKKRIYSNKEKEGQLYGWIITEGGAEYNSSKYIFGEPTVYQFSTVLYKALSYILGYDNINKAFFHNYDIKYILYQGGLTLDEIDNLRNIVIEENKTLISKMGVPDKVMEYLIKLYKNNKKGNWEEDKQFLLIISDYLYYFAGSDNPDRYVTAQNNLNKFTDSLEYKEYVFESVVNTIIEKDDVYTVASFIPQDYYLDGEIRVKITINDGKIKYEEVD